MTQPRRWSVLALAVPLLLAGCTAKSRVKMAFQNGGVGANALLAQALVTGDASTPTVFGVKLVAAYLTEDIDESMGNIGMNHGEIWTHPLCEASESRSCGIGPGAGAAQIKDYFDLALPTEAVNARLNAQGRTIEPGTYRYLRMDIAGPEGGSDRSVPNLRFGDGTAAHEVRVNGNIYTVKLDPPLELVAGDDVTIALGYDVRGAYYADPANSAGDPPAGAPLGHWYCGDQTKNPARGPCLLFPGFKPEIRKGIAEPGKGNVKKTGE